MCFCLFRYNGSTIERMFFRLEDFRRIVTRYDWSAANFVAAVSLAAAAATGCDFWPWRPFRGQHFQLVFARRVTQRLIKFWRAAPFRDPSS